MDKRNSIILNKILSEIKYLEIFVKDFDMEVFLQSEEKKRVVAMTLINIGELANHLTKEFIKSAQEVPFRKIVDLRNATAHGYHVMRFEDIWRLVQIEIPDLKSKINMLLKESI